MSITTNLDVYDVAVIHWQIDTKQNNSKVLHTCKVE